MLSNWHNGAAMINAMRKHLPDVKSFSHWGITGGAFAEQVPHETRAALSLSVLQTCGLRRERDGNALLQSVLRRALPTQPAFWERRGFVQIDCIDPLPGWEPGNPSAIYVKALRTTRGEERP